MRILLVEDDLSLGKSTCHALKKEGNTIDWLTNGQKAVEALSSAPGFDAIILDLGLPGLDGLAVLQKIRRMGINTPVMILTARDTPADRVKGLDSGSDDYLTKPFNIEELCARLRALQRRSLARTETVIRYRDIELNPAAHTVLLRGQPVTLARREFALLQKLLENAGQAITRETLSQRLYGWSEEVDSNTLEVHIHNLRKKFGLDFIRTIRGVGYMIEKSDENT